MDLKEIAEANDLVNRLRAFAATGHLDLDDVLILSFVAEQGQTTPGAIVRELELSAPAVSRRVRKLCNLDLLSEQVSGSDLRKCTLKPTVKATGVLHEIRRVLPDGRMERALELCRAFVAQRAQAHAGTQVQDADDATPQKPLSRTAFRIMNILAAAEYPLRVSQIARIAGCSQSTVSTAAKALLDRGLVCHGGQEGATADGRAAILELTPAGRDFAKTTS